MKKPKKYYVVILSLTGRDGSHFIGYLMSAKNRVWTHDITLALLHDSMWKVMQSVCALESVLKNDENVYAFAIDYMAVTPEELKLVYNASL